MGCGDVRLLRTIGGVDVTGQERAALNKLTMPSVHIDYVHDQPLLDSKRSRSYEVMEHVDSILTVAMNHVLVNTTPGDCGRPRVASG